MTYDPVFDDELERELEMKLEIEREVTPRRTRKKLRIPHLWLALLVIVAVILLVGPTVAVQLIVSHTFPASVIPGAVLTSSCSILNLTPGATTALAQCGTGAAFSSVGTLPVSASFVLPTVYASLTYVAHATTNVCTAGTAVPTTSTVIPAGNYDYCLTYTAPAGTSLPTFTVSWSQ